MRRLALSLALCGALPLAAHAQQGADSPSHLDDRWEISASWFQPDLSLSGRADLSATNGEETLVGTGFGSDSSDFSGAQVEAVFRPTKRQRIVAGWYGVRDNHGVSMDESGTYIPDGMDPVQYDATGHLNVDTRFQLYRLSYGYDLVHTPRFVLTGMFGVYGARASVDARSAGQVQVNEQAVDWDISGRWSETKHAPGIGLAATYRPAERWEIRAQAQGFQTRWGDFGTDGHFLHATAQVGYKMTPTWTVFAGYDHFNLELKDDVSAAVDYDGTRYQVQGPVSARLKVHGPTLGVRASF